MKTIMSLYVISDRDEDSGMKFMLVNPRHDYWMNDDAIKLDDVEIDYHKPDDLTVDQIRLKAIETLKKKQQKALADAEKRRLELQDRINQLLLLSNDSPPIEMDSYSK